MKVDKKLMKVARRSEIRPSTVRENFRYNYHDSGEITPRSAVREYHMQQYADRQRASIAFGTEALGFLAIAAGAAVQKYAGPQDYESMQTAGKLIVAGFGTAILSVPQYAVSQGVACLGRAIDALPDYYKDRKLALERKKMSLVA